MDLASIKADPRVSRLGKETTDDPGGTFVTLLLLLLEVSITVQLFNRPHASLTAKVIIVVFGSVIFFGALFSYLVIFEILRNRAALIGLALAISVIAWFAFIGRYTPVRDGTTALVGIALAVFIDRVRDWTGKSRARRVGSAALVYWLTCWIGMSVGDHVSEYRPIIDVQAVLKGSVQQAGAPVDSAAALEPRVTVALSGGGYRAALLHAGVLDELRSLGIRPNALSTVSGGSIIGSFYASGGTPEQFVKAVSERRFNLLREALHVGNVLHMIANTRLLWFDVTLAPSSDFSRTHVEADMLDRLYLGKTEHAAFANTALPELMICATDIVGARAVGVTTAGTIVQNIDPVAVRYQFVPAVTSRSPSTTMLPELTNDTAASLPGHMRRSLLVAASGAFPGAFKPLRTHVDILDEFGYIARRDTLLLADGGLADNMGLVMAYAAAHNAKLGDIRSKDALKRFNADYIISSDGSALNSHEIPWNLMMEVGKSIDVVYRSTSGEALTDPTPRPPTVPLTLYSLIQTIPSDLDRDPAGLVQVSDSAPHGAGSGPTLATLTSEDAETILTNWALPGGRELDSARAALLLWKANGANSAARAVVMRGIRADLGRHVRLFLRAPTLEDKYSPRDAWALFELGKYLVLLNRDNLLAHQRRGRQVNASGS